MDVTGGAGRLQGKHVLVTGGTTGIGFAIAERFLREGASVVVTGRNQELGLQAEAALRGDTWPGMRHMAPPGEEDRPESGDWPIPPIGRIGEARDVAAAAVCYASDEAEFITGTTLLVDGGMTAGYHQRENSPLAEPGPS